MAARIILTLVLFTCTVHTVHAVTWSLGLRYTGYLVPTWVSVDHSTHYFIVLCVASCMQDQACTGVYYNNGTFDCQHFYVDHFEFWWSNDGSESIVLVQPMSVVLVSEGEAFAFTFEDAVIKCAELRGRLITEAELTTLWSDGYEKCSCGWVQVGVNLQPERGGCDNGINMTNCALTKAHAYCVLN